MLQLIIEVNGANNNMKITQTYIEHLHSYISVHSFLNKCSHLETIDSAVKICGSTA